MSYKNVREIYEFLDSISPFTKQESWDNSGILIGSKKNKIKEIYLSLEATMDIANQCSKNSLLITHHPLIFKPINNIIFETYPNNIIEILIKKNIALISMHTNFDLSHLNEAFVSEILGFRKYQKNDFICSVAFNDSFDKLVKHIREHMPNSTLKLTQANEHIKNVAIICGSGFDAVESYENISCIITSDIKYHNAMKCLSLGISLIDVGHYDSESHFCKIVYKELQKINYNAIMLDSQNPFKFLRILQ